MQQDSHVFSGMRRDNHPIKQKEEFLWDALNIRLTNKEDDTLLSVTNEKGTKKALELAGQYVGHCIVGKYLVVFTAILNEEKEVANSYIYRISNIPNGDNLLTSKEIFSEGEWKESWSPLHPIETLGFYESDNVQKVYWVDGVHQTRFINVAKPELKGSEYKYNKQSFDFAPVIDDNSEVTITKEYNSGVFSAGTIQYAFTYFNKYEQETNIFYTTPLYYTSYEVRAESPEQTVANSFHIKLSGLSEQFDYVRVYSIHRTSLDGTATVKLVEDLPIVKEVINIGENQTEIYKAEVIDDGTKGSIVDSTLLLYIGGKSLRPSTLTSKDNTLFLGNIDYSSNEKLYKTLTKVTASISDIENQSTAQQQDNSQLEENYYIRETSLSDSNAARFQTGEIYHCGFQVQDNTGVWSEPVFVNTVILNGTFDPENIKDPTKQLVISKDDVNDIINNGGVKIRTCISTLDLYNRRVLCQGVLCPTVYNSQGRATNAPYAQSSWFFRQHHKHTSIPNAFALAKYSARIQNLHNMSLLCGNDTGAEIQNSKYTEAETYHINNIEFAENTDSSQYFVDENILTFHSPDLEFNENLANYNWKGTKLQILGYTALSAVQGDIDIRVNPPAAAGQGFHKQQVGFPIQWENSDYELDGGLVSGLFFKDKLIDTNGNTYGEQVYFPVYPWHRNGSLNNDQNRGDSSIRTAVLQQKKISNLKFFDKVNPITFNPGNNCFYDITTPQLFNSNEISALNIEIPYSEYKVSYMGNIDTASVSKSSYSMYYSYGINNTPLPVQKYPLEGEQDLIIKQSTDPVSIKYKSTPHLVFSLKTSKKDTIEVLPRDTSINISDTQYYIPSWDYLNQDPKIDYYLCIVESGGGGDPSNTPRDKNELLYAVEDDALYISKENEQKQITWEQIESNIEFIIDSEHLREYHIAREFPSSWNGQPWLPTTKEEDYEKVSGQEYYRYIGNKKHLEYNYDDANSSNGSIKEPSGTTTQMFTINRRTFVANPNISKPYLIVAQLYKESANTTNREPSNYQKKQLLWIPSSEPVKLVSGKDVNVEYKYGDTWYSRYDCLKTYPFTMEDQNSVVEIASFMCETRVNLDGRYDRNIGQRSNLLMTPDIFNLINPVYSQLDNYFHYRILDEDYYKQQSFPSQVVWSQQKHLNEEVDTWTQINQASSVDLDNSLGSLTKIDTMNDLIVGFQEKGLSQILFNSRVQIPTSDGVPIEISNTAKVDGSRPISGSVGCKNKWSIVKSPLGIYFVDSNNKSLYLFNGQLANLSDNLGMKWWFKKEDTDNIWNPTHNANIRSSVDILNGDVYFSTNNDALCYSEKLGQFTSRMSYNDTAAMFNYEGDFYSIKSDNENTIIYKNFAGDYNKFFEKHKPFYISYISNTNPTMTKVFDTIDFRADIYSSLEEKDQFKLDSNASPFNYIRVENEYQDTKEQKLYNSRGQNLSKKFRIWRAQLPRNENTRERIRNPWARITLGNSEEKNHKMVLHDISTRYTI